MRLIFCEVVSPFLILSGNEVCLTKPCTIALCYTCKFVCHGNAKKLLAIFKQIIILKGMITQPQALLFPDGFHNLAVQNLRT